MLAGRAHCREIAHLTGLPPYNDAILIKQPRAFRACIAVGVYSQVGVKILQYAAAQLEVCFDSACNSQVLVLRQMSLGQTFCTLHFALLKRTPVCRY